MKNKQVFSNFLHFVCIFLYDRPVSRPLAVSLKLVIYQSKQIFLNQKSNYYCSFPVYKVSDKYLSKIISLTVQKNAITDL
jgi:hypothetical protein